MSMEYFFQTLVVNPHLTKEGGGCCNPHLDICSDNTYTHRFWAKWLCVIVKLSFALISAKFE